MEKQRRAWYLNGRRLILFALVGFLSACTVLMEQPAGRLTREERQQLLAVQSWRLVGRVAVRTKEEAWHASLAWHHEAERDRLRLSGPFGQGAVSILVKKDFIQIVHADGTEEVSTQPDELLRARLGIPVPLTSLQYWVLAMPAPHHRYAADYYASGRLQTLRQSDWQINYGSYRVFEQLGLPQKMTVNGQGVNFKLVVDQWKIEVS